MNSKWLLPCAALCLTGCDDSVGPKVDVVPAAPPPPPIEAGVEAKLFPMKKGNQWVYASEIGSSSGIQSGEMTWRISAVREKDGASEADLEMVQAGKVIDRQTWRKNSKGIFQVSAGSQRTSFSPPQPIVTFPLKTGTKISYAGKGITPLGGTGTLTSKGQVLGPQEVDTDSGRVTAIAIQSATTFQAGKNEGLAETTSWYQAGVGLVRYRMDIRVGAAHGSTVLRLKSTNVKL